MVLVRAAGGTGPTAYGRPVEPALRISGFRSSPPGPDSDTNRPRIAHPGIRALTRNPCHRGMRSSACSVRMGDLWSLVIVEDRHADPPNRGHPLVEPRNRGPSIVAPAREGRSPGASTPVAPDSPHRSSHRRRVVPHLRSMALCPQSQRGAGRGRERHQQRCQGNGCRCCRQAV